VLAGAMVGNRWTTEPLGPWRNLMEPAVNPAEPNPANLAEPNPVEPNRVEPSGTPRNPAEPYQTNPAEPLSIKPMIPLGQFRDTFIIAIDDEGIAIIDQHVAHERVLFEQVMEKLMAGRLESQRLLTPMLIELSPAERQSLIPHGATLEKFGLEIEEFGGDSVRLSAVPAVLDPSVCEAAVRALAEDLEGLDRGSRVEDALRRIAATMACHAAVKANYPLTLEKMRYILEELRRTSYSSVCPHGRPVVLRITRREIEKNFQRI
jgi:DNA mismatch repair protein MutL